MLTIKAFAAHPLGVYIFGLGDDDKVYFWDKPTSTWKLFTQDLKI